MVYVSMALFFVILFAYLAMRYYGVGVGKTAIRQACSVLNHEFRVRVQDRPIEHALDVAGAHVPNITPDTVLWLVREDNSAECVLVCVYTYRLLKQNRERMVLIWGDFQASFSYLEVVFIANGEQVISCNAYEGHPPKFEVNAALKIREIVRGMLRDRVRSSINTVPSTHDQGRAVLSEPPTTVMPGHRRRDRPR